MRPTKVRVVIELGASSEITNAVPLTGTACLVNTANKSGVLHVTRKDAGKP